MSQENVDFVRRCYEALRRDDLETFLSCVDPEIEWKSLILEIEGTFHGHDGVREWWSGLRAVFPDWNPALVEVSSFGDRVIAHAHGSGSGVASGAGVDDHFWQVAEIRNGRIVSYRAVRTEAEALKAAGLSE